MTTVDLLSETVDSARRREGSEFERLGSGTDGKIVLFGAGSLGRKVLAALRGQGIEPTAFADNDPSLQGSSVEKVGVLSPPAAAKRWGERALFVVTIFLPTSGVHNRMRELVALGCRHVTSFLPLGWRFGGVLPHFAADLPSRLLIHRNELARVAVLWNDELSQETFHQELTWRLRANFEDFGPPAPEQYFPRDIIRPNPDESFVDGGAFDGDTLRRAPWRFSRIVAVEPDPVNANKLRSVRDQRVRLHEVVLGSAAGSSRFDGKGTMASARSEFGTLEVPVKTLDQLLVGERPTFIKLDVEGDELDALRGGRETLERSQPVVAACVYHKPEDLWVLPLYLHDSLPEHRLFLRAHQNDGFELVAYAVPPWRCL